MRLDRALTVTHAFQCQSKIEVGNDAARIKLKRSTVAAFRLIQISGLMVPYPRIDMRLRQCGVQLQGCFISTPGFFRCTLLQFQSPFEPVSRLGRHRNARPRTASDVDDLEGGPRFIIEQQLAGLRPPLSGRIRHDDLPSHRRDGDALKSPGRPDVPLN